jgi:hypothetical protein
MARQRCPPGVRGDPPHVWTFNKGRFTESQACYEKDAALKAVGLEELAIPENLDLVRSIHAAWERGDYSSTEWAHPEIEYVWVGGPSPGSWTGLAGMPDGECELLSTWED